MYYKCSTFVYIKTNIHHLVEGGMVVSVDDAVAVVVKKKKEKK